MDKYTVKVNGRNGKSYKVLADFKNVSLAMCGDYNGTKVGSICEMPLSVVKNAYFYGVSKMGFPKNKAFESTLVLMELGGTTLWTNGVRVVADKDF